MMLVSLYFFIDWYLKMVYMMSTEKKKMLRAVPRRDL